MKFSIKKISMLVMLGFILNSTTNCIQKLESLESKASQYKPESIASQHKSKASQHKPNKIITSTQIDSINTGLPQ